MRFVVDPALPSFLEVLGREISEIALVEQPDRNALIDGGLSLHEAVGGVDGRPRLPVARIGDADALHLVVLDERKILGVAVEARPRYVVLQTARNEICRHVRQTEIVAPDPADLGIALHCGSGKLRRLRVDLGGGEILHRHLAIGAGLRVGEFALGAGELAVLDDGGLRVIEQERVDLAVGLPDHVVADQLPGLQPVVGNVRDLRQRLSLFGVERLAEGDDGNFGGDGSLNALVDLDRIDEDHNDRVVLAVDGRVDGGELLAGVGLTVEDRRNPADLFGRFGRRARRAVAALGQQGASDNGEPLAWNWFRTCRRALPFARRRQRLLSRLLRGGDGGRGVLAECDARLAAGEAERQTKQRRDLQQSLPDRHLSPSTE